MRYRSVADRLADEILKKKRPGARLPGVRELARQEGMSLVTARNVYQYLMAKGLVITRQGVGTFVAYAPADRTIDMASIRPPEELLLWVGSHLNITLEGLSTYDPPQGFEPLREQARTWLASLGVDRYPIITAGSQQALFLVGLSLLKPGDTVAVEDPGYKGAVRIFESLGARVIPIPCISSRKDLKDLRSMHISLLYTMPQGHIPTGNTIPDDLRGELLNLALKKDFLIIEDDPLSEILGLTPLKALDIADRVIYIKSLSNLLGPGLRIGFAVVPEAMYGRIIHFKEINDLSLSGILQRILLSMLSSSDLKDHVKRLGSELQVRTRYLSEFSGHKATGPCLWIRTPVPSRICQEDLLHQGIRITPGDIYGPGWADHIRLSLLTPSHADFEKGLDIVQRYLQGISGPGLNEF